MYSSIGIFFLCFSVFGVLGRHENYDGHTLYSVTVKDVDQVKLVNELEHEIPVDIWIYALTDRPAQILVGKEYKEQFQNVLKEAGIEYSILQNNIREAVEEEERMLAAAARRSTRNSSSIALDYNTIHRYEVVNAYLDQVAATYPNLVTVETAGRSIQGREIKYLRISTTNFQDQRKPVVMLQSLLHAREWVTLPPTLWAIEKLVIDITERDLVENIDWIIMPIANPDGYVHTQNSDRFWRKNRRTNSIGFCPGVDLNRNFNAFWGSASSSSACSETFHGSGPFSEPETAAIRNVVLEHNHRMELYIDLHSFGSMILYGFGNGQLAPNALMLNLIAVDMAQAIDRVKWSWKRNYIVGNIVAVLYQASGGSSDWAQLAGATYSFTYELPGYNNLQGVMQGFLVDPDFIEQAGFETWEGIKVGARHALASYTSRLADRENGQKIVVNGVYVQN